MDILEISQEVGNASYEEVDNAIKELDSSLASEYNTLVIFCKDGNTDCAYDCAENIKKIQTIKNMLIDLREQTRED